MRLYNSFLEWIILPVGDLIFSTAYISTLKKWRQIQYFSEDQLYELQQQKMKNLINHCLDNIPYYRHQREGILKNGFSIKGFPVMQKSIIHNHINELLWHPEKKNKLIRENSSGSSGIQGIVYRTKKEQRVIQALQTLLWEWAGYRIGEPIFQTGMTLNRGFLKRIKDILFRTNYQSAFSLDEATIIKNLKSLYTHPFRFFGGYASSIYVYARAAAHSNITDIKFDSIISWGDKMFLHYRELIERQFQTKVYDTYGTTEGFIIGAQHDTEYYYILSPHVYVEIVDENGVEVPDGKMGYVLVTSLDAFEMPLVRYYIGDLAIKLPRNKYPKERKFQFPILESIIGRDTDIVVTPKGNKMIVHFFTAIFEHFREIKQFRVIQEVTQRIIIEYIPGINFEEVILSRIHRVIDDRLGEEVAIDFREVTIIPPSPSGKPQIIISKILTNAL